MNIFAVLPLPCDRSLYFIYALFLRKLFAQWGYKQVQ